MFVAKEEEEIDLLPKGPQVVTTYKDALFSNQAKIYKGVLIDNAGYVPSVGLLQFVSTNCWLY